MTFKIEVQSFLFGFVDAVPGESIDGANRIKEKATGYIYCLAIECNTGK